MTIVYLYVVIVNIIVNMNSVQKMSEKLYHRYSYLATSYANKIFSYEQLSFEYDDLVQEFRIKIFQAIKAYGRRWAKYRSGEATRPVPIKYYLACACANKMHDFAKYITRENNKTSIDEIHYDFGIANDTTICPESNVFILKGINLLEGLRGHERAIFSLFLKGWDKKIITKVYNNNKNAKIKASDVIERQKKYLIKNYGNDLLQQTQIFKTYNFDEE